MFRIFTKSFVSLKPLCFPIRETHIHSLKYRDAQKTHETNAHRMYTHTLDHLAQGEQDHIREMKITVGSEAFKDKLKGKQFLDEWLDSERKKKNAVKMLTSHLLIPHCNYQAMYN